MQPGSVAWGAWLEASRIIKRNTSDDQIDAAMDLLFRGDNGVQMGLICMIESVTSDPEFDEAQEEGLGLAGMMGFIAGMLFERDSA
jgi:hypothetical protein